MHTEVRRSLTAEGLYRKHPKFLQSLSFYSPDAQQRSRSSTIRRTEAPSVAFSAPVNIGGVAHARLNLSSTSSGEIERDDAFSSTVSIISHTDVLWRQRLDIVNTVKTVMQAVSIFC